jgi:hypothetical protein
MIDGALMAVESERASDRTREREHRMTGEIIWRMTASRLTDVRMCVEIDVVRFVRCACETVRVV